MIMKKQKNKSYLIAALIALLVTLLTVLLVLSLRPIKSIEITNSDVDYSEALGKYKVIYFDSDMKASYKIEYKSSPSFLKKNAVKFECDGEEGVSVDKDGVVTFTSAPFADGEMNSVTVKIVSKNGKGNAEDSIMIIAAKQ